MFTKNNTMNEILNRAGRTCSRQSVSNLFYGTCTGGTQGSYDGTD